MKVGEIWRYKNPTWTKQQLKDFVGRIGYVEIVRILDAGETVCIKFLYGFRNDSNYFNSTIKRFYFIKDFEKVYE